VLPITVVSNLSATFFLNIFPTEKLIFVYLHKDAMYIFRPRNYMPETDYKLITIGKTTNRIMAMLCIQFIMYYVAT